MCDKKAQEAFLHLYKALSIDNELGALNGLKYDYEALSTMYEQSGTLLADTVGGKLLSKEQMALKALYFYRKFIAVRDTIFSEESKKELVRKQMNFDFEKKGAATKAEQDKKDVIAAEEKQKQKIIIVSVSLGLILVLILALVILRSLRQNQKKNKIITEQKELVEHQKELVEEKQKEIIDSIFYARRIQRALITPEKYIDKALNKLNAQ